MAAETPGLVAQPGERTVRIGMDAHRPTMAGPKFRGEIPLKLTKTQNFKNPLFVLKNGQKAVIWARSSAGRAFGSHPKGSGVRSSSGPPFREKSPPIWR